MYGKLYITNEERTHCILADEKIVGYDYDKKEYYCRVVASALAYFWFSKVDAVIPIAEDGPYRLKFLFKDKLYLTLSKGFQEEFTYMET